MHILSIFLKVKQVTLPLKIIVQLSVSTGTTVEIYSFVFFFSEIGGWAFTWYITLYTILVQKWGVGAYKVLYSKCQLAWLDFGVMQRILMKS